jgi:hypothetical protein
MNRLRGKRGDEGVGPNGPYDYNSAGQGNLTKLITEASQRSGIDPRIMEGIRAGESGHGRKYDYNPGTAGYPEESYGPFQLNRLSGLGVQFEKETAAERARLGLGDLRDPKTIALQADWVAKYIKRTGNLSPWMGYHGPRDADPHWGDAGYNPTPAVPVAPAAAAPVASPKAPSAESIKVPRSNIRLPAPQDQPWSEPYPAPGEKDGSGKHTGAYDFNRQRQSWRENAQHYLASDMFAAVHHHYDNSDHSVTHHQVANNTIHITGVSDPHEAASAVGSTLAQVFPPSKSATRHLASALG